MKFVNGASSIEKLSILKSISNSLNLEVSDVFREIYAVPSKSKSTKSDKRFHFENLAFPKEARKVSINVWCDTQGKFNDFMEVLDWLMIEEKDNQFEKKEDNTYLVQANGEQVVLEYCFKSTVVAGFDFCTKQDKQTFDEFKYIDSIKSKLENEIQKNNIEFNLILLKNYPLYYEENNEKRKEFIENYVDPKLTIRKAFLQSGKIPQFLDAENLSDIIKEEKEAIEEEEKTGKKVKPMPADGIKNKILSAMMDNFSRCGVVQKDVTIDETLIAFKIYRKDNKKFLMATKQEGNEVKHFDFSDNRWVDEIKNQLNFRNLKNGALNQLKNRKTYEEEIDSLMKQVVATIEEKAIILFDAADRKDMWFIKSEYLNEENMNRRLLNKASSIVVYSKEYEVPYVIHMWKGETPKGTTMNTIIPKNENEFFSHGIRSATTQVPLKSTKYTAPKKIVVKQHTRYMIVLGRDKERNIEVATKVSNNRDLYIGYEATLEKPYLFYVISRLSEYEV